MNDLNAKAAEMFAAGENVNAVAAALFNKNWAKAKKLHIAWLAKQKRTAPESAASEAAGDGELFAMTVDVPAARLGDLIATFSEDERAFAVQQILQRRMDVQLGVE